MTTDPRRLAVVAAAASQIGPGDVPLYWKSCKVAPPYPPAWCGALALWALHEADLARDVFWVIARGFCEVQGLTRTLRPLPGDIAYTDKPWQHHAVVESLENGILTTIDGNQPDVQRKVRPLPKSGIVFYSIEKFLRATTDDPPLPLASTEPPPATLPALSLTRGVDVSHHQAFASLNWPLLAQTHRFAIARATYGSRADTSFAGHVQAALAAGMTVGAYMFFRPGQGAQEQVDAFHSVVAPHRYGPGWIVPALDVEQNVANDGPVSASRYAHAELVAEMLREEFGGVLLYTNPAMWTQLGNPGWIRDCSIWIAHYNAPEPRVPFHLPWDLWQHRVAPVPGHGPLVLDQNYAMRLPVIADNRLVSHIPLALDWDEIRRDRDAIIRDG